MNEKDFEKMDETMMKKMEPLRSKEISEAILRGFPASVERRIGAKDGEKRVKRPARLVWAPAVVMAALALFLVVKTPVRTPDRSAVPATSVELAQLVSDEDIQDEIALLSELEELDEDEGALFPEEEELFFDDEVELAQKTRNLSVIV